MHAEVSHAASEAYPLQFAHPTRSLSSDALDSHRCFDKAPPDRQLDRQWLESERALHSLRLRHHLLQLITLRLLRDGGEASWGRGPCEDDNDKAWAMLGMKHSGLRVSSPHACPPPLPPLPYPPPSSPQFLEKWNNHTFPAKHAADL